MGYYLDLKAMVEDALLRRELGAISESRYWQILAEAEAEERRRDAEAEEKERKEREKKEREEQEEKERKELEEKKRKEREELEEKELEEKHKNQNSSGYWLNSGYYIIGLMCAVGALSNVAQASPNLSNKLAHKTDIVLLDNTNIKKSNTFNKQEQNNNAIPLTRSVILSSLTKNLGCEQAKKQNIA